MPLDSMDNNIHMLRAITNNFSKERKVGSGRNGDVYKGLYNGEEFAVMKLHPLQGLDDNAFDHESRNLIGIHHPNVVRLIGYYYELRKKKYVEHSVKPDFEPSCRNMFKAEALINTFQMNHVILTGQHVTELLRGPVMA